MDTLEALKHYFIIDGVEYVVALRPPERGEYVISKQHGNCGICLSTHEDGIIINHRDLFVYHTKINNVLTLEPVIAHNN